MSITIRQVCADAAGDLGIIGVGDTLSASDAEKLITILRRLLNSWNADRRAVYATAFPTFTLITNPTDGVITIGPTGDFVVDQRPVTITGANLILNTSTPATNTPIAIRDEQWWLNQTVPQQTSDIPTDLYYQPDWPNGKLYFWPVPTAAYDVQLMTRVVLDDTVDLSDTFSLPPGYQQAITLTLEEFSQRPFGKPYDPTLALDASRARAVIFGNNDPVPRLLTRDSGMMPGRSGNRADFNWLDGSITSR